MDTLSVQKQKSLILDLLKYLQSLIFCLLIFLFPLFFLPLTQEFYATHKFYLLGFSVFAILIISVINTLIAQKIAWKKSIFDGGLILFLIAYAISVIISSPNKIQALLNPTNGFGIFLFLAIFYFIISNRGKYLSELTETILTYSVFLTGIITIIFFFQPFKKAYLPSSWQFLKNPFFTPLGSQIDLVIFLGFFIIYFLHRVFYKKPQANPGLASRQDKNSSALTNVFNFSALLIILIASCLTIFSILKSVYLSSNQKNNAPSANQLTLPPYSVSWYGALEVLKQPKTAIFGAGIDNFGAVFTKAKTFQYNQTPLWSINFNQSRSFALQLLTEAGLLGFLAFAFLLFHAIRIAFSNTSSKPLPVYILYLTFVFLIFPPSSTALFLFFITLAGIEQVENRSKSSTGIKFLKTEFNFSALIPLYISSIACFLIIAAIVIGSYLLGRTYQAEVNFKKSLDGLISGSANIYEDMRQAIILNPYIERFRINFSQINLLIANNVAAKTTNQNSQENKELTDQDKQTIIQAIQAAINEAKTAVSLNPQKTANWENLAAIYQNLINVAQGTDAWTVSAYQRAIVTDPANPRIRLALGGLFYSLGNYDDAIRLFEQSASLKTDWANAYYNLAWASFKKEDYKRAVAEMENALYFVDKKTADLAKVKNDLEEFKKKLPKEESKKTEEATSSAEIKPSELSLPKQIAPAISPKIELPEEASPEDKVE